MIALVGLSVMGNCFQELTESAADAETIDHITRIIAAESRVHHWHNLRTRTVGREVFLDLHILVDPQLTITAAHEIAETLETTLHHQLPRPVNITVHIEPDTAELRK
jgi:divalent metal cation (Fe/Co/Zn/Cd) transporter